MMGDLTNSGGASGRAVAASPSSPTVSPVPASIPDAEPEPDLTWFLIAVDRGRNVVILDHSDGWKQFGIEFHWEDTFSNDPPLGLAPGAYLYRDYSVGWWDEDDYISLKGGTFEPYAAQGTSASGQDPQGLEAKPAGPVPEGNAPKGTSHD